MKLSLLDLASLAVDSRMRPATFSILLHLKSRPDLEVLREGARLAMGAFPRSACSVQGWDWVQSPASPELGELSGSDAAEKLDIFVSGGIDATAFPLIQQRLVQDPVTGRWILATRMHHVLGDGVALLLWLSAQLGGALPDAPEGPVPRIRHSPHSGANAPGTERWDRSWRPQTHSQWGARRSTTSPRKRWKTLWLDEERIRRRLREERAGHTLNDLLCSWIFEALGNWAPADARGGKPLSLWLPLSVRRDPFSYFGNASSRIRLAECSSPGEVRTRIEQAMSEGAWDLGRTAEPISGSMAGRLFPASLVRQMLRLYFARPTMDPCTTAFSFASRVSRHEDAEAFPGVERIETIGHLHSAHSFAFSATSFGGSLGLTLFWDPARIDSDSATRLWECLGGAVT